MSDTPNDQDSGIVRRQAGLSGPAASRLATRMVRDLAARAHADLDPARDLDELTGLPNRRAFVAHIEALGNQAEHSIVRFDVGDFRDLNFMGGLEHVHRVLREVADALADACAPHMVCRWDGDEFAAVVLGNTLEHVGSACLRALSAVRALEFPLVRSRLPPRKDLIVSVGAAPLEHGISSMREADAAVCEARQRGGEQWVWLGPSGFEPPRESADPKTG